MATSDLVIVWIASTKECLASSVCIFAGPTQTVASKNTKTNELKRVAYFSFYTPFQLKNPPRMYTSPTFVGDTPIS